VREIVPGLILIDFRVTSAYLIVDSELTLVDAGMRRGATRILQTIGELRRAPTELRSEEHTSELQSPS